MVKWIEAKDTPKDWPGPARVSGWYVVVGRAYPVIVGEPHATRQAAERTQAEFHASEYLALSDCNRRMSC